MSIDQTKMHSRPNVVLVHGAWADGSSWSSVIERLQADGVMKDVYRRTAEPGVYLVLEGSSIDAVAERVNTLPFVVEGLMTIDYEEIHEI